MEKLGTPLIMIITMMSTVRRNNIFSIFSKATCKLMCSLRCGLFKLKLKSKVSHQFRS